MIFFHDIFFLYVILILSFFLYFSNCCSNLIIKQHKNVSKYQSCLKSSAKCLFFPYYIKGGRTLQQLKISWCDFPIFFFVLSFRLETGYPVGGFVLLFFRSRFCSGLAAVFFNIFVVKLLFFKAFQAFLLFLSSFYLLLGLEPHRINFSC